MNALADIPELKVGDVNLSDHAYERAKERLNHARSDKSFILNDLRGKLKYAKCLGEIISEKGNRAVLYAEGRTAIYLSPDLKTIVTVNRFENITHDSLKCKVKEIHEKELRKLRRRERCLEKRNEIEVLKLNLEFTQLDLRIHKTRSAAVKKQCRDKKKEIEQQLWSMENELKKVKDEIRRVSQSLVSIL